MENGATDIAIPTKSSAFRCQYPEGSCIELLPAVGICNAKWDAHAIDYRSKWTKDVIHIRTAQRPASATNKRDREQESKNMRKRPNHESSLQHFFAGMCDPVAETLSHFIQTLPQSFTGTQHSEW